MNLKNHLYSSQPRERNQNSLFVSFWHFSDGNFRIKTNDQLIPLPESEPEPESQLSVLIFDISQQAQGAMENMLRMISEIDQNAVGILEGIENCRGSALDRKGVLEEKKQQFQQAAYTVLDMLNNGG